MKVLALALFATVVTSFVFDEDLCPHDKEVECITDPSGPAAVRQGGPESID